MRRGDIRRLRKQKSLAFQNGCVWGAAIVAMAEAIRDRECRVCRLWAPRGGVGCGECRKYGRVGAPACGHSILPAHTCTRRAGHSGDHEQWEPAQGLSGRWPRDFT